MAYPPTTPPSNRLTTNPGSLPAQDHDQVTAAVNDIITELGSTPKGAAASLSARLNAVETTASAGATGPVGMVWRGVYSAVTTYGINDAFYDPTTGISYIVKLGATAITPPNSTYYDQLSGVQARSLDLRAYGGAMNARIVADPTSTSASASLTLPAGHGVTAADVGKTAWVFDAGGNGTLRTISIVSGNTITLSGTSGKTLTAAGGFIYGTPIDTAIAAAFTAAAAMTTVDTSAGVNTPWGPINGVEVYCGGGTGIGILTTAQTVPRGVMLNVMGIVFGSGAGSTPYLTFQSNSALGRLHIDVGAGSAILVGDSTSAQAHWFADDIVVWNRGGPSSNLVECDGLDFQINRMWTKGGATALRCVSGTDCRVGHLFAIGSATALALSQTSQFTAKVFADSCTAGVKLWSGVDNVDIDIQVFKNSSTGGTTRAVVFGEKDDGTTTGSAQYMNNDVKLKIQARDPGDVVLELNYCQDVKADIIVAPAMTGTGLSKVSMQSTRGQTTGVKYGTSVGDGIWVDASFPSFTQKQSDNTTPAYATHTGTPVGRYRISADGEEFYVTGVPSVWVSGTTAPVTTKVVTREYARRRLWTPVNTVETFPFRMQGSSNTINLTSQQPRFTYFWAEEDLAATKVSIYSGGTAWTGGSAIYLQVHSVDGSGNLTRLAQASQTSTPTWLTATNTAYEDLTLDTTVNFDAESAFPYVFEVLIVNATAAPTIVGIAQANGNTPTGGIILAKSPRRAALGPGSTLTGQSSYTAPSTNTANLVYARFT